MPDHPKIFRVDSLHPEPEKISEAEKIIRRNGVAIFPARCLYGIAANAMDTAAVESVFNLKKRPENKPILVLIPDRSHLPALVKSIPETAATLMDAFWPGHLTLVFEAADHIPVRLTAGTGKIGIRVPIHPVACALTKALDLPITGTSANLSGHPGCSDPETLDPDILSGADIFLNAGTLKGGAGSTIIDITGDPPNILRQGEISRQRIAEALNRGT